jgi:hypothetical protein
VKNNVDAQRLAVGYHREENPESAEKEKREVYGLFEMAIK